MHIEQYMDWRVWWVETRDTLRQDVSTVGALGIGDGTQYFSSECQVLQVVLQAPLGDIKLNAFFPPWNLIIANKLKRNITVSHNKGQD